MRQLRFARANGIIPVLKVSALLALACPALLAAQSFTDIGAGLTGVHHGSSIWGDYDNDNDLDLLVTGETASPLGAFADVYSNNGGGTFGAISAGLTPIYGSAGASRSAWGDFDGDGKLDMIVTGSGAFGAITTLYHNNGAGFAVESVTPGLPNISLGSAAWGDYDNDGDLDLFICGYSGGRISTIYRNDGSDGAGGWLFTNVDPFASYPQHERIWSDGAWGDDDNDGDLDLIVIGTSWDGTARTTLYRNDGGVMVQTSVSNLVNVTQGSVTWGDLNNDGWLDLVITGSDHDGSGSGHCEIYTNNHNGSFTHSQSLYGVGKSSAAVGDYNNDGKLDLVVTGYKYDWNTPWTTAYTGNGDGTLTEDTFAHLRNLYEGQVAFGDYDNDGRLDLVLSGRTSPLDSAFTIVYHNTTGATANTLPSTPLGLTVTSSTWNSATVQWSLSSDAQSPTAALHYNLRVEDQTAGTTVMTPMSDPSTGYRQLPQLGNTNHNASWTIGGLISTHTYRFIVQSIDQAYAASGFSSPVTVTLPSNRPDVVIGDCAADVGAEPNPVACGSIYYNSNNIWLRNLPDGFVPGNDYSQNPAPGDNYVYVRLKNIGPAILNHGRVYVYWAKAATVFNWPMHWSGNYNAGVLEGDSVGSADVSYLSGGGGGTIVQIRWPNVPSFSHFCLLARFVSAEDPMTFPENTHTDSNTINNNNIAWVNITVSSGHSGGSHHAPIGVYNTSQEAMAIDLHFTAIDGDLEDNLLDHVDIKFHMGAEMYQRWLGGGARGNGIKRIEGGIDADNDAVLITSANATLEGIRLEGGEQVNAELETVFPEKLDPTVAGRVYHFDLAQYESGAAMPSGGEYYEIHMPGDADGKKALLDMHDLTGTLELVTHPNPTTGITTIGYTLPGDARVSLSLYDMTGRIVRTLVPISEQKAGHHEAIWDGRSSGGERLPSGLYLYRVQTSDGVAEGSITITR